MTPTDQQLRSRQRTVTLSLPLATVQSVYLTYCTSRDADGTCPPLPTSTAARIAHNFLQDMALAAEGSESASPAAVMADTALKTLLIDHIWAETSMAPANATRKASGA